MLLFFSYKASIISWSFSYTSTMHLLFHWLLCSAITDPANISGSRYIWRIIFSHKSNMQWWDRHRITSTDICNQKEGKWKLSKLLVHRHSEILLGTYCISWVGTILLSWSCSLLFLVLLSGFLFPPSEWSFFSHKKHSYVCFLFIKAWGPKGLYLLYFLCPFYSKLGMLPPE